MKVADKWGQRGRGCYLVEEKKSRHWVVEVTDKWGVKKKRMLLPRREEEQT